MTCIQHAQATVPAQAPAGGVVAFIRFAPSMMLGASLWEQGAGGSNPLTPTRLTAQPSPPLCSFCAR